MGSLRNSQSTTEHPEYTEKHKIVISEGEMVSMDGQLLKETKQLTTVTSDDPAAPEERMYKEVIEIGDYIQYSDSYLKIVNIYENDI